MSERFIHKAFLFLITSSIGAFAAGSATVHRAQVTGYLVDVSCSRDEAEVGAGWGEKHTRACLLMPACVRSGYAVLTSDNKVIRFDAKGNQRAYQLILAQERDKNWHVRVRGQRTGNELKVSDIALLK